jgi:hypothetical protein
VRLVWPPDYRKSRIFVPVNNRKLFQFLHEVHDRGPRLGRVLGRGLPADGRAADPVEAMPLAGGCYLVATGRQQTEQAFVPGVFQRLLESENTIRWSERHLAEDARFRRLATAGYVVILLVVLALAAAFWFFTKKS